MEFFEQLEGGELVDGFVSVDGLVADFLDEAGFLEEGFGEEGLEVGVVEQGAEGVVVGKLELGLDLIKPVDEEFEGAAAVEAGGVGIGVDGFIREDRGFGEVWELGVEEGEVGGLGHWGRC